MFDISNSPRSEPKGGHDRLAGEKIRAAGIRYQCRRDPGMVCFSLRATQRIEIFGLKTDFGAGKVTEILSENLRIQFLAFEEGTEISIPA